MQLFSHGKGTLSLAISLLFSRYRVFDFESDSLCSQHCLFFFYSVWIIDLEHLKDTSICLWMDFHERQVDSPIFVCTVVTA